MAYKYGIYQSSSKSCIFYKEDEDGKQSTFNIFIKPMGSMGEEEAFAFIDNEQMKKENWSTEVKDIRDVIEAFGGWAVDAPIVFELEAQRSLSQCLGSIMKKKE
jgi:hypothetical protein